MKLIMVDDSEQTSPTRTGLGHLVGVGAVVFPEEGLAIYRDGIRALRQELGIPADVELKWSPDDGSWLKTAEGNAVRTTLRRRMLALGVEAKAVSLVVVWDRGRVQWSIEEARREVLKYLYDKVSFCVRPDIGLVIADEPGGGTKEQKAWLTETLRLTDVGTEWTKPDQIVLPILMAPSHHVPHLQLADLVTGATVAAVAGNKYALELLPELKALAHKINFGMVGGAGLTLWPPELANLYYHLYGDDTRWRLNTGAPLPHSAFDYFDNDGLPAAGAASPSPPSAPTS